MKRHAGRDWLSKRALKKMVTNLQLPEEYVPDEDNRLCVEGGSWDAPNGIEADRAPPDATSPVDFVKSPRGTY